MKDIYKSALWALISIPISLFGHYASFGLIHTGGILLILYLPAFIAVDLIQTPETPEWLLNTVALIAQYLAYVLVILILRKIFKILKETRAENIAKEQAEKNQTL